MSGLLVNSPACTRRKRPRTCRSRRGIEVLEIILALPVLLIATIALIELGVLMVFDQTVVTASTKGAREAGKGANITEIRDVVNTFLGVHGVAITEASNTGNIVLEVGTAGGPVVTSVNSNPCTPPGPAVVDGEVRVTVGVELLNPLFPSEAPPVPDALATFGFSLSGRSLKSSTLVRQE